MTTGADLGAVAVEAIVLRRVTAGGVRWAPGGSYHDHGRALGGELAAVLDRLLGARFLVLGGQHVDGHRAVAVTVAGLIRTAELRGRCCG